jgi:hypothetical protein
MSLISPAAAKMVEKARKVALEKHKNTEATVDRSVFPKSVGKRGSRVKISRGDITNDEGTQLAESVTGRTGSVAGTPYVSPSGPNKGKVVQPVLVEGTNALVGVPTDRLSPADAVGHSRPSLGWTPKYERAFESIFGKRKRR